MKLLPDQYANRLVQQHEAKINELEKRLEKLEAKTSRKKTTVKAK